MLGLSYLSFPFYTLFLSFGFTKMCGIYIVRMTLAALNAAAFAFLRRAVSHKFGEDTGIAMYLALCSQFHLPFYMSRTLPNTYALCLCTIAFAYWLRDRRDIALAVVTFAGVCFRCDLILLAVPMGLSVLVTQRQSVLRTVAYCLIALAIGVALSLSIDSFFWQRFVWPELEVLLFNTVENRSAEWGTSPWHWYFSSALPRILMGEAVLVLCALFLRPVGKQWVDMRLSSITFVTLAFVGLYSFLPHKELRFLFPIMPALAVIAAVGLVKL